MSIEKPDNERMRLYERFRQSLAEGDDAEFFDADDLIIIIDQAVDLEDEYVQIEALMRGYRFFPDNEELANRRAFLYYDLNLDRGVEDMVNHKSDASPMWDVLKLRLTENDIKNAGGADRMLDEILASPGKFNDEMIIQLVDCASACGSYQWLKDREKALRDKAEYLPSLLYELFIVADMQHDNDYSVKLLEELTETEPFNADFWFALAQVQSNMERLDDALVSIDYALAIDPDHVGVQTLKASIYIRRDLNREALDILEPLYAKEPDHVVDELRIRAIYGLGQNDRLPAAIEEAAGKYPEERIFFEFALHVEHPDIERLMQLHYDAQTEEEREKWLDWAIGHYVAGRLFAAIRILQALMLNNALPYRGFKFLASALYCDGQYQTCVDLLKLAFDTPDLLMPDIVVAGLMSLVRLGKKREIKNIYRKVMDHFPMGIREPWTLSSTLESIGFTSFLGVIDAHLDAGKPIDFDELNIFKMPQTYKSDED